MPLYIKDNDTVRLVAKLAQKRGVSKQDVQPKDATRLNLRDCFAYACAKANNAVLLFKVNDFARTDIPAAL